MTSQLASPAFGGTVHALINIPIALPGKDTQLTSIPIAAGQTLQAGSVMGIVTATGEAVLSLAAASDGSERPYAILMEDLDTSLGAQSYPLASGGVFNELALVFGAGHTADTVRIPLRDRGIYLNVARYSFG